MRHQGLGWVAALSLSPPQEQQHPSQTLRAKRNSPFLQEQSPLSPLQYIHSLIHPEPVKPRISEQIQPPPLAVSVSSTPLHVFLCHRQDCCFPALWSCLPVVTFSSFALPSSSHPAASISIPCKESHRRQTPAKQVFPEPQKQELFVLEEITESL